MFKRFWKPLPKELWTKPLVVLPDGRIGLLHHQKTDGKVGVRPLDGTTGRYLPNTSAHWTYEDRLSIPEEVAVSHDEIRPAARHEYPKALRRRRV